MTNLSFGGLQSFLFRLVLTCHNGSEPQVPVICADRSGETRLSVSAKAQGPRTIR